jgi:hypothetical protein
MEKRTADEYRAMAAAARKRAADSFERCDTDGCVSQWANDTSALLYDRLAALAEAGWVAHFKHLYTLDGERVNAKAIRTRYGLAWAVMDDAGQFTGEFLDYHLKPKTLAKKGYEIREELAPAYAELRGSGKGLAGAMSVRVVTFRTDERS